jgi:hypothetical protein
MTDIKEVGMGNAECGKIAQKAKSIAWSEGRYQRMRKSASGLSELQTLRAGSRRGHRGLRPGGNAEFSILIWTRDR